MGFPRHLVRLIESIHENQELAFKIDGENSEWFCVEKGVRQGYILSPYYLFNTHSENTYNEECQKKHGTLIPLANTKCVISAMLLDMKASRKKYMKELLRARGREADQEGGGVRSQDCHPERFLH